MEIAIKTNPLRTDTEEIAGQLEQLKKNMSSMNEAIQSLNTMWKGDANTAFVAQYLTDYQIMTELCQTLGKLVECMGFAASKYDECDTNVKNIIKAIKI